MASRTRVYKGWVWMQLEDRREGAVQRFLQDARNHEFLCDVISGSSAGFHADFGWEVLRVSAGSVGVFTVYAEWKRGVVINSCSERGDCLVREQWAECRGDVVANDWPGPPALLNMARGGSTLCSLAAGFCCVGGETLSVEADDIILNRRQTLQNVLETFGFTVAKIEHQASGPRSAALRLSLACAGEVAIDIAARGDYVVHRGRALTGDAAIRLDDAWIFYIDSCEHCYTTIEACDSVGNLRQICFQLFVLAMERLAYARRVAQATGQEPPTCAVMIAHLVKDAMEMSSATVGFSHSTCRIYRADMQDGRVSVTWSSLVRPVDVIMHLARQQTV